jgi:hypothetical protein
MARRLSAYFLFPPKGEEKKEPEQRQERSVPEEISAAREVAHRAIIVLHALGPESIF